MIASRTKSKCDKLKAQLDGKTKTIIHTAQVDADNVEELVAFNERFPTRGSFESCITIPRFKNYGCLFGSWLSLCRHR